SHDQLAPDPAQGYHQTLSLTPSLLYRGTVPMRLERFRTFIHLVQHYLVRFVLRQENVELQGSGFGLKAPLRVGAKNLEIVISLASGDLKRRHNRVLRHSRLRRSLLSRSAISSLVRQDVVQQFKQLFVREGLLKKWAILESFWQHVRGIA